MPQNLMFSMRGSVAFRDRCRELLAYYREEHPEVASLAALCEDLLRREATRRGIELGTRTELHGANQHGAPRSAHGAIGAK